MYQYHDTKKEQIYVTYILSGKIGKPSTYTHRQFLTSLLLSTHNKVYFLSQFSKFNQQFRKQNQNSLLIRNTCKFKKKKIRRKRSPYFQFNSCTSWMQPTFIILPHGHLPIFCLDSEKYFNTPLSLHKNWCTFLNQKHHTHFPHSYIKGKPPLKYTYSNVALK